MTTLLEACDLTLVVGGRGTLTGAGLLIASGDQIALSGRSGSGKTTLLLALAGLLAPHSGHVRHEPGVNVVYVPQSPSLLVELTALENVTLPLRLAGLAPAEAIRRSRNALATVELADAADALPDELSVGMQQRVALARALVVEPDLLLADEPTGALDRRTGEVVIAALRSAARHTSGALLVATHDSRIAASFRRRLVLEDGDLVESA